MWVFIAVCLYVYCCSVLDSDNPLIIMFVDETALSHRRSKFQIIIELLTAISHGEHKPTRLMYTFKLSWNSMKNTLSLLESKGYIDDVSFDGKRKHYCVTESGREVLGYYSRVEDLIHV